MLSGVKKGEAWFENAQLHVRLENTAMEPIHEKSTGAKTRGLETGICVVSTKKW